MSNDDPTKAATSSPSRITELRAVEWELAEVIRRLEVLRDEVRRLQNDDTTIRTDDEPTGAL